MFNFVANAAAIFSLASTTAEAGKKAVKYAGKDARSAVAIHDIKNLTGDMMLSTDSEKHGAMKEIVRENEFFTGFHKALGAANGFCRGLFKGIRQNLPQTGFSILTLASKNKTAKTIGVAGLGLTTAWDFLKNGTNLFTKKDLIEK